MYANSQDKTLFRQVFPPYNSFPQRNPSNFNRQHFETGNMSFAFRSKSVIIPVNTTVAPISSENKSSSQPSSSSSYWSWTYGLTTFPFFFWGCPFYALTSKLPPSQPPIRTTGSWIKRLVDCGNFPFTTFLSTVFLFPYAILINILCGYMFVKLFKSLFVDGVYEDEMFKDILEFLQYLPIIIPLNYVWLRGFRINNMVNLLNRKRRKYSRVSCNYHIRLIFMIFIIVAIHIIRYFSYEKYTFARTSDFIDKVDRVVEFTYNLFASLMLPVYVTFCYGIQFEFVVIKAVIYDAIRKRVKPSVTHLNKFKTMYTHAADHIVATNDIFSIYLSLSIILMMVSTVVDAQKLIGTLASGIFQVFGWNPPDPKTAIGGFIEGVLPPPPTQDPTIAPDENAQNRTVRLDPVVVRQVNADVVCVLLTYALIFYTVWQAVGTNDMARELNVWLNDFVSGGGGTDVKAVLMDLGLEAEKSRDIAEFRAEDTEDEPERQLDRMEESQGPLLWAHNKLLEDGQSDELTKKFNLLKSYIHVRMQLEKPALLNISLVGILVPSLSGRLRNYNIMF